MQGLQLACARGQDEVEGTLQGPELMEGVHAQLSCTQPPCTAARAGQVSMLRTDQAAVVCPASLQRSSHHPGSTAGLRREV